MIQSNESKIGVLEQKLEHLKQTETFFSNSIFSHRNAIISVLTRKSQLVLCVADTVCPAKDLSGAITGAKDMFCARLKVYRDSGF